MLIINTTVLQGVSSLFQAHTLASVFFTNDLLFIGAWVLLILLVKLVCTLRANGSEAAYFKEVMIFQLLRMLGMHRLIERRFGNERSYLQLRKRRHAIRTHKRHE